jgi:hypothetical protein
VVGSVGVGGSRNIGWTIYNASLGFPTTTISAYINRATFPEHHIGQMSTPHPARLSGLLSMAMVTVALRSMLGRSAMAPIRTTRSTTRNTYGDIGGLDNRYTWYFWGRGHNAVGWSNWSARASAIPFRVPDPPSAVALSGVTNVGVHTVFSGGWDGGTPVREWQLAYGTDPNAPTIFVPSSGTLDLSTLTEKTTYYFWARGRNDIGWGAYGPRSSIRTQGTPDPPSAVVLSGITQTTMNTVFTLNADNGQPITGQQIGYAKNSTAPEAYTDVALNDILRNLEAGTLYYFWTRAKNVYGWGPLSVVQTARTAAGAWINVNGVWKEAVPFVNVNGEWKLAQAFARIAGVWKGMQ